MIVSKERRKKGGEKKKRKMVVRGIKLSFRICKAALILTDLLGKYLLLFPVLISVVPPL